MASVEVKVKLGFVIVMLTVLLAVGTFAFSHLEAWGPVDAFYFSAITLTTIGYGDLFPTTTLSKIFTVFYAILGVALVLYALGIIARWYVQRSQQFEEHELARIRHMFGGNNKPKQQ